MRWSRSLRSFVRRRAAGEDSRNSTRSALQRASRYDAMLPEAFAVVREGSQARA